jgi:hypothetical protein
VIDSSGGKEDAWDNYPQFAPGSKRNGYAGAMESPVQKIGGVWQSTEDCLECAPRRWSTTKGAKYIRKELHNLSWQERSMAQLRSKAAHPARNLLIVAASVAILFHFFAVIVHVLAAPGLPWHGPDAVSIPGPPSFARTLDEPLAQGYLKPLKLTHNYHFPSNHPIVPGVYVELKLKDAKGETQGTLCFPDPESNAWVRYLEGLFAQGLVPDQPIAPPQGEEIPAPHQQVRTTTIWDGEQPLRLHRVPEHLIPRNRPVFGPTEWSQVLVDSYVRYLRRKHGAASVEVVRHSRDVIPPTVLLEDSPPPMAFKDLLANYGDTTGEQTP